MDRWTGKVAVVTGASSGIGAAIVRALADSGCVVIGLARREDSIKKLAASCKGRVHARKCDVTVESDVISAFSWIKNILGGVDILVNCAGALLPAGLIDGATEDWSTVLNTNVMALTVCTREALKSMRHRGDCGHIIHINSISGHYVPQFAHIPFGLYPASKHAVTALTESLRVELEAMGSSIKVTSISPGSVHTEMLVNMTSILTKTKQKLQDEPPPGQLIPEDVAGALIYALSVRPHVQVHEIIIQAIGQKTG